MFIIHVLLNIFIYYFITFYYAFLNCNSLHQLQMKDLNWAKAGEREKEK